ncbi:MAG: SURF1 family protein [Gammaproteobacteria bacterium]|nr:MAG: SURF1 family protein [Gammaproteobacteria bacterium]
MHLGQITLRPTTVPTVAMLIAVPLFTALGAWQLDRAETKRDLRAELAARWDLPAVTLPAAPAWSDLEHRRVTLRGRFVAERQFIISDRVRQGRRGVHVVTPLQTTNGHELLVNRGWVTDSTAADEPPEQAVTLTGRVALPQPPALELGPAAPANDPWSAPWSRLDPVGYAVVAGVDPLPAALLLDPDQPHGFARDWPRPTGGLAPSLHIGYALQWFAFAALAAGIWLIRSLRRPEPTGEQA